MIRCGEFHSPGIIPGIRVGTLSVHQANAGADGQGGCDAPNQVQVGVFAAVKAGLVLYAEIRR